MSKSFAERNPRILGLLGTVILAVVLFAALSLQHIPFVDSGTGYSALFSESGGLESGADVVLSGVTVGSVSSVRLDHGRVRVDFEITDGDVRLGSTTTASITTQTVLGKRGLKLVSSGAGPLRANSTIPRSRTVAPYDLTQALAGLTTTSAAIDTASFAKALRTITATFQNTPKALRSTATSVSRISTTIASRDQQLHTLLSAADNVTGILAQRNTQISTLLADGTTLLTAVNARRGAIESLLLQVTRLARQLDGLVSDNKASLGPALNELDRVVTLLNKNKQNIQTILDRAGPFAGSLGEAVSSGPFFQAYVQNLTRPLELSGLGGN